MLHLLIQSWQKRCIQGSTTTSKSRNKHILHVRLLLADTDGGDADDDEDDEDDDGDGVLRLAFFSWINFPLKIFCTKSHLENRKQCSTNGS